MKRFLQRAERAFRKAVVYPFFQILFRRRVVDCTLNLPSVRKLLILRHDRIGDMIVTTPIFRNLKLLHPGLHLGVFASSANAEIIRHDPHVDAIYVASSNILKTLGEIRRARRERYDVVMSFVFNRTTTVALLARLAAPHAVRIGHADEKYHFYFNRLVKLPRFSAHMTEVLAAYLKEVFGLELQPASLRYEIHPDPPSVETVDRFLAKHGLQRRETTLLHRNHYLVFNVSAKDAERRISSAQARAVTSSLANSPSCRTVLICAPDDREMKEVVKEAVGRGVCLTFPEEGVATLLQIASLVEGALGVITPDTALVHFASAAQTPMLGFFTTLQGKQEWLPFGVPHNTLVAPEGLPVSAIPLEAMQTAADKFLKTFSPQLGSAKPSLPV